MAVRSCLPFLLISTGLLAVPARADSIREVKADPPALALAGPGAHYSLLIHGRTAQGRLVDLTHTARFLSTRPEIAQVTEAGAVRAIRDGRASITIEAAGQQLTVPVTVEASTRPRSYHFANDIIPILSRYGCNASGCHGKAEGQNGFKLSVFGFDPAADFAALTKESRGRRVFPAAPDHSLLLAKISGAVPHGGGLRIPRGSVAYQTLRGWIAAGVPFGDGAAAHVASIRVEPAERQLDMKASQQLRVIARYSDGREIDVTAQARFQSNNDGLASVGADGLVTAGEVPGDVAIMASYLGAVDTFRAVIPRGERIDPYPRLVENNFIDTLVFRKLRKLNIIPSGPADDATFLRRVSLDVIGTLPTADEVRRFLADRRPDRRARLVDDLLRRPEFADYWALKWADLLRVDRETLGPKRAYAYYRWIRAGLAADKPFDQFAREIITAEGPLQETGPADFYKVVTKPGEMASTLSQVFLGVRIACAQCHHHPFDRWSQADYYGMEAFFAPVRLAPSPQGEALVMQGDPPTTNPRTGEAVPAHVLGAPAAAPLSSGDRREVLARWMTASDNPYFARNLANRTWAHFLGRGLVEPVDDVRATNPPSNPELLEALARYVVEHHYDFRELIRLITASRVYQLSTEPNHTNERDEQNYSRALFKRLDAEVLLDMVCQTTGVPERFSGQPPGTRAIQLWDSKVPHYFLKLFGRPVRVSACECERNHEPSVAQVLHVLNAPELHAKLTHDRGTVARLVRANSENASVVEDLYLMFFGRYPTTKERAAAVEFLATDPTKRRAAAEDLAWAMMNSLEFQFNH